MTNIDLGMDYPDVHINDDGKIVIKCDTHDIKLTLNCKTYGGPKGPLVRALYEATLDWMVLKGEVDPK